MVLRPKSIFAKLSTGRLTFANFEKSYHQNIIYIPVKSDFSSFNLLSLNEHVLEFVAPKYLILK